MKRKKIRSRNVSNTTFRWSKQDRREGYPERLQKILDAAGLTFNGANRAMWRCFVDEVEKRGFPLYRAVVDKATNYVEKLIKENGKKNGRKKKS